MEEILVQLRPLFPNLTDAVINISIKHPSNNIEPRTPENVFQRCIDDLLELRTYTLASGADNIKHPETDYRNNSTISIDSDDDLEQSMVELDDDVIIVEKTKNAKPKTRKVYTNSCLTSFERGSVSKDSNIDSTPMSSTHMPSISTKISDTRIDLFDDSLTKLDRTANTRKITKNSSPYKQILKPSSFVTATCSGISQIDDKFNGSPTASKSFSSNSSLNKSSSVTVSKPFVLSQSKFSKDSSSSSPAVTSPLASSKSVIKPPTFSPTKVKESITFSPCKPLLKPASFSPSKPLLKPSKFAAVTSHSAPQNLVVNTSSPKVMLKSSSLGSVEKSPIKILVQKSSAGEYSVINRTDSSGCGAVVPSDSLGKSHHKSGPADFPQFLTDVNHNCHNKEFLTSSVSERPYIAVPKHEQPGSVPPSSDSASSSLLASSFSASSSSTSSLSSTKCPSVMPSVSSISLLPARKRPLDSTSSYDYHRPDVVMSKDIHGSTVLTLNVNAEPSVENAISSPIQRPKDTHYGLLVKETGAKKHFLSEKKSEKTETQDMPIERTDETCLTEAQYRKQILLKSAEMKNLKQDLESTEKNSKPTVYLGSMQKRNYNLKSLSRNLLSYSGNDPVSNIDFLEKFKTNESTGVENVLLPSSGAVSTNAIARQNKISAPETVTYIPTKDNKNHTQNSGPNYQEKVNVTHNVIDITSDEGNQKKQDFRNVPSVKTPYSQGKSQTVSNIDFLEKFKTNESNGVENVLLPSSGAVSTNAVARQNKISAPETVTYIPTKDNKNHTQNSGPNYQEKVHVTHNVIDITSDEGNQKKQDFRNVPSVKTPYSQGKSQTVISSQGGMGKIVQDFHKPESGTTQAVTETLVTSYDEPGNDMQILIAPQYVEKSPEEKLQEMQNEVLTLFPDVDSDFLKNLIQIQTGPNALDIVCNHLLENKNYPKRPKVSVPERPKSELSKITSNKDFYSDYKSAVNYSYRDQCEILLQNEFRWVSVKDIRIISQLYNGHYAPMHRAFSILIKKFTQGIKDGSKPTYSQGSVTCSIPVGTSEKKMTIHFLKCLRPIRTLTSLVPELKLEYDFVQQKQEENAQEDDLKFAMAMNEHEYEECGQLIECGCCYAEVPFDSMVQCYEGHLFCQDCLKQYAQESVYGQGKADLLCMTEGCGVTFPLSQLNKALPSSILSKYHDRVQEENINLADLPDLVRCPHCEFAAVLDSGDKVFTCQNPSCMKETCRYCKEEWSEHFGKRCDEIEKKDEVHLRVKFEEKMTEAKIRTCHRCKTKYMKSEGCNKMTCRCGGTMCYFCRKPNIDYNHFCQHLREPKKPCNKCKDCFLWSNAEEDDERAIEEIRKRGEDARREKGYTDYKPIGIVDEPPAKRKKCEDN